MRRRILCPVVGGGAALQSAGGVWETVDGLIACRDGAEFLEAVHVHNLKATIALGVVGGHRLDGGSHIPRRTGGPPRVELDGPGTFVRLAPALNLVVGLCRRSVGYPPAD